jgi:acetylornithine deacetylase/succinyl-diaminopimelate desuccinylase-like protein
LIINPSIIERVLDLAVEIQQIPAATFHEGKRAIFLSKYFHDMGASDAQLDDLGNVYSRIKGVGMNPAIVVSAHLDTVFPLGTDLTVRRAADKIYGPGIGDNSLGLAGLCGLYWALNQNNSKMNQNTNLGGDIWLVANVGEEGLGNLIGMKAVVDRFRSDPLAYIVLEGMALGQIYHRGLGVKRYRISVHTKGGHSWVDFGRPSAIHELADLVVKFNAISLPVVPRTSLNVGMITGGTSVNTIAAEASCELDLRSENAQELIKLSDHVLKLVEEANYRYQQAVKVKAEVIGERPAGEIPANHPLVSLGVDCYAANGIQAKLNIGSTDANEPLSRGLPAVCVGLTSGRGSHSKGEFIDTKPVSLGVGTLVDLIKAMDLKLSQAHPDVQRS